MPADHPELYDRPFWIVAAPKTSWKDPSFARLLEQGVDGIIFGADYLSVRTQNRLAAEEIKEAANALHEKGVRLYINALKIFRQSELDQAFDMMKTCVENGADGFYIADEAMIVMARKLEEQLGKPIVSTLVYAPDPLLCSREDAQFYLDLGLESASLASELSLEEFAQAAADKNDLEIQSAGHIPWLYSARNLLSNYFDEIEQPQLFEEDKVYFLREMQRPDLLPAWQDENGTQVFSPRAKSSLRQMQALYDAGFRRFRIDAIFHDWNWAAEVLSAQKQMLEGSFAGNPEDYGDDSGYGRMTQIRKGNE